MFGVGFSISDGDVVTNCFCRIDQLLLLLQGACSALYCSETCSGLLVVPLCQTHIRNLLCAQVIAVDLWLVFS